jgi:hypothetical protein
MRRAFAEVAENLKVQSKEEFPSLSPSYHTVQYMASEKRIGRISPVCSWIRKPPFKIKVKLINQKNGGVMQKVLIFGTTYIFDRQLL